MASRRTGGIVRSIYKGLSDRHAKYEILHEVRQVEVARRGRTSVVSQPITITALRPIGYVLVGDGVPQLYDSPFQLPNNEFLRNLFLLEIMPHPELRTAAFRLVPRSDEAAERLALGEMSLRLQSQLDTARQCIGQGFAAGVPFFSSLKREGVSILYNTTRIFIYHWLLHLVFESKLLDPSCAALSQANYPFFYPPMLDIVKTIKLSDFSPRQPMLVLAFFYDNVVNDFLAYLGTWTRCACTALCMSDPNRGGGVIGAELLDLYVCFHANPLAFCFDDALSGFLANRGFSVVLARAVSRGGIKEDQAAPAGGAANATAKPAAGAFSSRGGGGAPGPRHDDSTDDATFLAEIDVDEDVEDDTMQDAAEELERKNRQEVAGRSALDTPPFKVRIMSQKDLVALCEVNSRWMAFPELSTETKRRAAEEAVFLYQQLCVQLRVGNNFCDRDILTKVHETGIGYVRDVWRDRPVVRDEALRMLEQRFKSVARFELSFSPIGLSLLTPLRVECFLYRWIAYMLSLDACPDMHPLNAIGKMRVDSDDPQSPFIWQNMFSGVDTHRNTGLHDERVDLLKAQTMKFDEHQINAAMALFNHRLIIVNGPPGSGKTTFVTRFIRMIRDLSADTMQWCFATPTCKSMDAVATNLGEVEVVYDRDSLHTAQWFIYHHRAQTKQAQRLNIAQEGRRHLPILFIDEASLWPSQLVYDLLTVFDPQMLVVIGDLGQCMPINWGFPWHVLAEHFERNKMSNAVKLRTEHRFQGALSALAKSIRTQDVDLLRRCVQHVNASAGCGLWSPAAQLKNLLSEATGGRSVVAAVDDQSNMGNYRAFTPILNKMIYELDPPDWKARPPLMFVTFSRVEMRVINDLCALEHRSMANVSDLLLLGGVRRSDWNDGTAPVIVNFPERQRRLTGVTAGEEFTPWGIQIGDIILFRRNMAGLHGVLEANAPFLQVWKERYVDSMGDERVRALELADAGHDYVSNGDRGMLVQIYELDPFYECPHLTDAQRRHRQAKKAAKAGKRPPWGVLPDDNTSDVEPPPLVCRVCSAGTSRLIGGEGWSVNRLVARMDKNTIKAANLSGQHGPWLVLVVWLDRSNALVHVPIPVYDATTIMHGYAITFFRAQGSQENNICFVCSNRRFPERSNLRNAFQKQQDRSSARNTVGTRHIDQYWYNDRTFYVAATRARKRMILHFAISWQEKSKQLLECHDPPPNILGSLLDGSLKLPEERFEGMPKPYDPNQKLSDQDTTTTTCEPPSLLLTLELPPGTVQPCSSGVLEPVDTVQAAAAATPSTSSQLSGPTRSPFFSQQNDRKRPLDEETSPVSQGYCLDDGNDEALLAACEELDKAQAQQLREDQEMIDAVDRVEAELRAAKRT